ncbi:MAG: class I SAM-dependent methyltransferase [Mesorhizobium sp.]|uniref:methyltransferase domain-containing protein n=1 Tax=Mesorhizobium sp. TaxID=1871066 RepID=UPI000FE6B3A8|nr:methyltransferase domain-containing protein [Mesorhizobium sp.]RWA68560.1 MAG: class I SAM-dependent methyltransferase [Mesorhizobium sp.]RWB97947.1 MAG: class I SAM-dependent methyltransferase [Mesorhizobium sp.]
MLDEYRKTVAAQTLWATTAQTAPWNIAFQNHVRALPRLARLTLNLSLQCRLRLRNTYAARHLRGQGMEIGAQYVPTQVGEGASVEYVDVLSNDELVARYRLPADGLVPLAHVIDGHDLKVYPDNALDFLIANHVLEHFDDALKGMIEWFRTIKPGGHLFITLPNFRGNCFDYERAPERADHFLLDYTCPEGREARNRLHYEDMAKSLLHLPRDHPDVQNMVDRWIANGDRHHYHVWDETALQELLEVAAKEMQCDLMLVDGSFPKNGFELLAVVRKGHPGGALEWRAPKIRAAVTFCKAVYDDIQSYQRNLSMA